MKWLGGKKNNENQSISSNAYKIYAKDTILHIKIMGNMNVLSPGIPAWKKNQATKTNKNPWIRTMSYKDDNSLQLRSNICTKICNELGQEKKGDLYQ